MSKAKELIEELKSHFSSVGELTASGIKRAFEQRLVLFNIDDVSVDDVSIDLEGDIRVTFVDEDSDEMSVVFFVDDEDDTIVALIEDDDEAQGYEDEEVILVDLTPLNPPIKTMSGYPNYVNLADLSWMNKSTLMSILRAGDVGPDSDANKASDSKGNPLNVVGMQRGDIYPSESLDEQGYARVVRGGKAVRLPLVRRKRRKILTGKQKQALRKAALARRSKKGQIARKRKRSLKVRKSMGIKRRTNTQRFKVQGGADRRR